MSDKPKKGFWGFWTTLRGVLAALAALVTIVGGTIAVFGGGHASARSGQTAKSGTTGTVTSPPVVIGTSTGVVGSQESWANQMNAMCREEGLNAQAREAAANTKPGEAAQLEIQASAMLSLDRQLRASKTPPQDELKLLKLSTDWDAAASELDRQVTAQKESEKVVAEEHEKRYNEDNELGNELADGLGLKVCAAVPL
jgi:hypothetical protein